MGYRLSPGKCALLNLNILWSQYLDICAKVKLGEKKAFYLYIHVLYDLSD